MGEPNPEGTKAALDSLGQALLAQLDPDEGSRWLTVEFRASREALRPELAAAVRAEAGIDSYRMEMSVRLPEGDQVRIPRPGAVEACAELDRLSELAGGPRWRSMRFLLSRQADGRPQYQCWWEYDQPAST